MQIKAYAKVNLSLDVVGKRKDGYHLLKMIMQRIDLYDSIIVNKNLEGIKVSCNKSYVPVDERNLVHKAAKLFIDTYGINQGVNIYIEKNIPVAAGLAGGSTNAAAVLKCMRDLFKPNIDNEELKKLGLNIGADVPYCIEGGTALCEGIGEIITPLRPYRNRIMILVKPNFGVSTKDVYESLDIDKINRHPDTDKIIKAITDGNSRFVSRNMKNVLENVTLKKYSVLKEIKSEMFELRASGALMSGSGPTIFAFFDDMLKAQNCYDKMKKKYKEVYITRTI